MTRNKSFLLLVSFVSFDVPINNVSTQYQKVLEHLPKGLLNHPFFTVAEHFSKGSNIAFDILRQNVKSRPFYLQIRLARTIPLKWTQSQFSSTSGRCPLSWILSPLRLSGTVLRVLVKCSVMSTQCGDDNDYGSMMPIPYSLECLHHIIERLLVFKYPSGTLILFWQSLPTVLSCFISSR